MKKFLILTLILFVSFAHQSKAQTYDVKWTYLFGGDSLTILRTGTKTVGTDVLSVYQVYKSHYNSDTLYIKEGGDTTFLYTNNTFYFLYANTAQVGDVWHPLRFSYSSFSDNCNSLHDFTVTSIDSIQISGEWLKRFYLNGGMTVVENIGPFGNQGFLYNFIVTTCIPGDIIDVYGPMYCFQSYEDTTYSYTKPYACNLGIKQNSFEKEEPLVKRTDNCIEVTWNEKDVELELYNISGQKVKSAQKNSMILPQEQGIYFLHIQQNSVSRVVKLAN